MYINWKIDKEKKETKYRPPIYSGPFKFFAFQNLKPNIFNFKILNLNIFKFL